MGISVEEVRARVKDALAELESRRRSGARRSGARRCRADAPSAPPHPEPPVPKPTLPAEPKPTPGAAAAPARSSARRGTRAEAAGGTRGPGRARAGGARGRRPRRRPDHRRRRWRRQRRRPTTPLRAANGKPSAAGSARPRTAKDVDPGGRSEPIDGSDASGRRALRSRAKRAGPAAGRSRRPGALRRRRVLHGLALPHRRRRCCRSASPGRRGRASSPPSFEVPAEVLGLPRQRNLRPDRRSPAPTNSRLQSRAGQSARKTKTRPPTPARRC